MALYCDIRYDPIHLGIPISGPAVIEAWLVSMNDSITAGSPIARLRRPSAVLEVRVTFDCVVGELKAQAGQAVGRGDHLLRVFAEGDQIPGAFRYCATQALAE